MLDFISAMEFLYQDGNFFLVLHRYHTITHGINTYRGPGGGICYLHQPAAAQSPPLW